MMHLFALQGSALLGAHVAAELGVELAPHEERVFDDGEFKLRPLQDVRGSDVYVVHALHGESAASPADKLLRLLFFGASLRDHGAARVVAVLPYLAFARKDRRTQAFDPVDSRYVAQLIEASGFASVLAFEVHNVAAFDNAFRIPALHLTSAPVLAPAVLAAAGAARLVVASPDPGGIKRAQLFREVLVPLAGRDCGFAFVEKRRSGAAVSGDLLAGDVRDATVILVDDLISTGGTLRRAARSCLAHGARRVLACAAHGLFSPGADEALSDPALSAILITDSVPPRRLSQPAQARVQVVGAAAWFATAIQTLHGGATAR